MNIVCHKELSWEFFSKCEHKKGTYKKGKQGQVPQKGVERLSSHEGDTVKARPSGVEFGKGCEEQQGLPQVCGQQKKD